MRNRHPSEPVEIRNLQERCDTMSDLIMNLLDAEQRNHEELRYLHEFLSYKNLEEEFHYFQRNAVEVYEDDLPFPYLRIKVIMSAVACAMACASDVCQAAATFAKMEMQHSPKIFCNFRHLGLAKNNKNLYIFLIMFLSISKLNII